MAATISKLSEVSSHRVRGVSGPSHTPGGKVTGDGRREREVAAGIIRQRKEDEEKNCSTEKYSGLRIK